MLGRLLSLASINYTIFERDSSPDLPSQGGTLDIHGDSGQLALRAAGLFPEFEKLARYEGVDSIIADMYGKVVAKMTPEKSEIDNEEKGKQSDRPEMDRRDLRALLLRSVDAEKVRWGKKVETVVRDEGEKNESSFALHFADGSVGKGFKLVVGADGAWSKARSLVSPSSSLTSEQANSTNTMLQLTSSKPIYSGKTSLTTSITPSNPYHATLVSLIGNGNYHAIGQGKMIIAQRMGDGSYTINHGFTLPENWTKSSKGKDLLSNPSRLREWLIKEHLSAWAEANTNIIKFSEGDFRPWPLYHLDVKEAFPWTSIPGITLLGDAAHLT